MRACAAAACASARAPRAPAGCARRRRRRERGLALAERLVEEERVRREDRGEDAAALGAVDAHLAGRLAEGNRVDGARAVERLALTKALQAEQLALHPR